MALVTKFRYLIDAGWERGLIRWTHTPKTLCSNPAPATKSKRLEMKKLYEDLLRYSLAIREVIENGTDRTLSMDDAEQIDNDRMDIRLILESEM